MKKLISILLVICLLFCGAVMLISCNDDDDADNDNGDDNPENGDESQNGGNTNVDTPDIELTYEQFKAMSKEERVAFYDSFENKDDYFIWYNAAKAKYDEEQDREIIDKDDYEADIG